VKKTAPDSPNRQSSGACQSKTQLPIGLNHAAAAAANIALFQGCRIP
jgi:hypothetical protein